jgi:hypothetical protein
MASILRTAISGLLLATAACSDVSNDELGSKPEWSALQSLEVQYRNAPRPAGPLIRKEGPYCAAGLLAVDGKSLVWILLNAEKEPLVKKLPELDYRLSKAEVTQIEEQCGLSQEVRSELESHTSH